MNNVQCAGKKNPTLGGALAERKWPCEPRWKGERYTTDHSQWLADPAHDGIRNRRNRLNPAWVAAVTAKPCPRCGGTVVLIEVGDHHG